MYEITPTTDSTLERYAGESKDTKHRARRFDAWLASTGRPWHAPDLARYRDALQVEGLAPRSIAAHLATVRGLYRRAIHDNALRDALLAAAPAGATPADRKAFTDEVLARIENAIQPEAAPVRIITAQDHLDGAAVRLTKSEAEQLLAAPGTRSLVGLRDTAIIALLLCTGIREAELCALQVPDLRQELGGELALWVREGKGAKSRAVPYGDLAWALAIVEAWLAAAGIESGAVFRGFYHGGRVLRDSALTPRAVQQILAGYELMLKGKRATVRPHDLRRTYARRLYEAGLDLVAIQQNLGHASTRTTLGYIGALDADRRRAPAVYSFDLRRLAQFAQST